MKTPLLVASILLFAPAAIADQWVNGYVKSDGSYVPGHFRSSPNATQLDNFSYKGNVNPYTGEVGQTPYQYRAPAPQPSPMREYRLDQYQSPAQSYQRNSTPTYPYSTPAPQYPR